MNWRSCTRSTLRSSEISITWKANWICTIKSRKRNWISKFEFNKLIIPEPRKTRRIDWVVAIAMIHYVMTMAVIDDCLKRNQAQLQQVDAIKWSSLEVNRKVNPRTNTERILTIPLMAKMTTAIQTLENCLKIKTMMKKKDPMMKISDRSTQFKTISHSDKQSSLSYLVCVSAFSNSLNFSFRERKKCRNW